MAERIRRAFEEAASDLAAGTATVSIGVTVTYGRASNFRELRDLQILIFIKAKAQVEIVFSASIRAQRADSLRTR